MWNAPCAAPSSVTRADPRLALLRAWLSLGVLVLLVTPVSAWHSHSIGWLPYWCVVAPAVSLALLRRRFLASARSAFLVRGPRRRSFVATAGR